jgi:predicted DsbA family dithiol-disulfide isomerase
LALQALEIYPGQIRFEYHPYPACDCPCSDFGFTLAQAVEAAGAQGKFWELHNRILEDAPKDMAELEAKARDIGLDMEKFTQAIESGEYAEKVCTAKQAAIDRGVDQLGFFINGKKYQKAPGTLNDMIQAIEDELSKATPPEGAP